MKTKLATSIKEILDEIVGDCLEPVLTELPFRNPDEIREALSYIADEVEGLDAENIFVNLKDPQEFVEED